MTVRDHLARQKRRCFAALYGGFITFAAGAAASSRWTPLLVLGLLGFGISFVSMMYLMFAIRCPRCRERLGQLVAYVGGPFTIPRKLQYCPFCGFELDTPIDDRRAGSG